MEKTGETKTGLKNHVLVFFLFLISYAVLFGVTQIRNAENIPVINLFLPWAVWDSPLFPLIAPVGFFFAYFGILWARDFFESKLLDSKAFPIMLLLVGILAFYFMLYLFYIPNVIRSGASVAVCIWDCDNFRQSLAAQNLLSKTLVVDFWPQFRNSAFIVFLTAGLLGWASLKIEEILKKSFF